MPRRDRESESQISPTAGTTSAVSTGPRRGRSRSPCRYRRVLHDYDRSDSSSGSSGSERSGRDRRHRRRRKSGGRSRSRGHRCHRRRSRDTERLSSESDSDDDDSETSYESEGSRDRKRRRRSKGHKGSKRGRKSPSRKTRKGGSRRKRSRRSDSEDSGTPYHRATANAKSGNDVAIRYRGTAEARSQAATGEVIGPTPLPRVEAAQTRCGGELRPGESDAIARFVQQGKRVPRRGEVGLSSADETQRLFEGAEDDVMSGSRHARINAVRLQKEDQAVYSAEERRAVTGLEHEQKARRVDLSRLVVDRAPEVRHGDLFTLRTVHES